MRKAERAAQRALEADPEVLCLTLPLPPTVNSLYHRSRSGAIFKDKKARDYYQLVWEEVLKLGMVGRLRMPDAIRLDVLLWVEADHEPDIDNGLKVLIDALAASLAFNDRRVTDLRVRKRSSEAERPRCVVVLSDAEASRTMASGPRPGEAAGA